VLALDVGTKIEPKIGLELRKGKTKLVLQEQQDWYSFMNFLVSENQCLPEKRDGLISWSGRARDIYHEELFRYYAYRFINYFKVVFEPDCAPRVKAYFSLVFLKLKKGS